MGFHWRRWMKTISDGWSNLTESVGLYSVWGTWCWAFWTNRGCPSSPWPQLRATTSLMTMGSPRQMRVVSCSPSPTGQAGWTRGEQLIQRWPIHSQPKSWPQKLWRDKSWVDRVLMLWNYTWNEESIWKLGLGSEADRMWAMGETMRSRGAIMSKRCYEELKSQSSRDCIAGESEAMRGRGCQRLPVMGMHYKAFSWRTLELRFPMADAEAWSCLGLRVTFQLQFLHDFMELWFLFFNFHKIFSLSCSITHSYPKTQLCVFDWVSPLLRPDQAIYVTGTDECEGYIEWWKVRLVALCGGWGILFTSLLLFFCFSAHCFGLKDA